MSKGTLGGQGQVSDMMYRGPTPGFGPSTMELKNPQPSFGVIDDMWRGELMPQPGYQQPQQPQQPNQGQQQQQQYFQEMHKNMDGMNQALKQIEGMKMPGQQYNGGFAHPGGMFGGGKGKGGISY